MKKIYSLLAMLMLLAVPAMAQVNSLTDLYGKYRFTADLEIVVEAYASELSADCDVEISATELYSGKIVGFCGSQNSMNINDISTELEKIKVTNPNNPQLWTSLYLANAEGEYPYGVYDSTLGEWTVESYGPIYFDYDPATKEITVPDFTVVTCDHVESVATVVARYTNVKMTLVEAAVIEVADISGDWNFKAGSGTYDTMQGSLLPTEFAVSLAKTGDDNRNYKATVNVEGANEIVLDATFDGNMLALPYDSVYLNDVLRLAPMYGPSKKGTIEFMSSSEDVFTLYSGFSIARDSIGKTKDELSDSTIVVYEQWYAGGTLKRPSSAPAFTWDGTFTVNVNSSTDIILADGGASGIEWPAEFQMVVQYYDVIDAYYVVEFLGFNVGAINNGGIPLEVGADGTTASIELGDAYYGHSFLKSNGDGTYVALTNQNGVNNPINMTLGDDGTISIEPFFVQNFDFSSSSYTMPIVFYQNAVATKYVEPEAEPYDWSGTYALTSNVSGDGADSFPQSFYVTVTYVEAADMYLVTEFAGKDIAGINYGGLLLTPDEENGAVMGIGNIAWQGDPGNSNLIKLRDENGSTSDIKLTINEDGTISVADFMIMAGPSGDETTNVPLAEYTNVLLVKDGEIVAPEPPTEPEEQYYRIYSTSQNKYLHIESFNANNTSGPKGAVGLSEYVDGSAESANQIFKIEEAENGLVYLVSANEYYIVCRQWNVDACNDGQKSALGMDYINDTEFRLVNGMLYFKVGEVDGAWGEYYPYCDAELGLAETWRLEPATLPVGIENVVTDGAVVKGIYDITGRKIEAITAPGLYIVDGKKVLVK